MEQGKVFYLDKYEAAVAQIMKLSDKEREELISTKKKSCICDRCPTYNECAKEKREIWYCALGKSPECVKAQKENKGGCDLSHIFFDTKLLIVQRDR